MNLIELELSGALEGLAFGPLFAAGEVTPVFFMEMTGGAWVSTLCSHVLRQRKPIPKFAKATKLPRIYTISAEIGVPRLSFGSRRSYELMKSRLSSNRPFTFNCTK